jgi:hypothetical protein
MSPERKAATPIADDRKQLRRSLISIVIEHPVITLVVSMLIGALMFAIH